jgi:hypothetical protein
MACGDCALQLVFTESKECQWRPVSRFQLGIVPFNWFSQSEMIDKAVSFTDLSGDCTGQLVSDTDTTRQQSDVINPISVGIVPFNWFLRIDKYSKFVSFPNSVGIFPDNWLRAKGEVGKCCHQSKLSGDSPSQLVSAQN